MDTKLIYVTTPDIHEARNLGGMLVEQRLAACVNIIQPVESMFWWEGEVQRSEEAAFVAKTTGDLVPRLIDFVKEKHSYDCPCVVVLDIKAGNPDFLKWIADETHGTGADG
jgi:periplasmic divalent cation tolerance protein